MQHIISIKIKSFILAIVTLLSTAANVNVPTPDPQQTVLTPEVVSRMIDQAIAKGSATPRFGAAPSPAALSTYTLAGAGVSSSATSITLTSLTIKQSGQKITGSNLVQGASDKFYVTLEPGNTTRQEIAGCTGVTQNSNNTATLTGCSRGMTPIYPYTASTTLSFSHAGSSQVVFGDAPQIFNDFKTYVDSAVVSGAVDSSLTAKGIVEKASGAEAAAHASVGSGDTTAPLALTTDIASSTRLANTKQVVVASSTGYIDNSYIATSTAQGGTLALFNNPIFTGTTTVATSTTYFTNGLRITDIGKSFQAFISPGTTTFSVPSGVTKVLVRLVGGAGGSSARSGVSGGCGGGAGGYGEGSYDITGTTSIQVFVGANSPGTWSTFGTNGFYLSAGGGASGGAAGSGAGGTGGSSGSGGYFNSGGQSGVCGATPSGGSGGDPIPGASYFGGGYGGGGNGGAIIVNW